MSGTKHTPGPWVFDGANGKILIGKNELLIPCKKTIGGAAYTDDWYADAKVITAAPELLAMLKKVLVSVENEDPGFSEILSVIEKADPGYTKESRIIS